MLVRFCLYSIFKNLRFFEQFFVIYLLAPASMGGVGLTFFQTGLFAGYQKLLTALLEVPTGFVADSKGRRHSLIVFFATYVVAFPLFGISARVEGSLRVVVLLAALTLFGVGEAFRTGTHKSVMLDWSDKTQPEGGATRVIGIARFWSKLTAGLSALAGGLILWQTGSFQWLFFASTVPAILGVVLVWGYPRWLEGEYVRERTRAPDLGWRARIVALWAAPGIGLVFLQSVLFESQMKMAQHYLQPFLQFGLEARNLAVVGGIGALLIGLYYLVYDGLSSVSAVSAGRFETRSGSGLRALDLIHVAAAVVVAAVAGTLLGNWLVGGAVGFLVLAVLQNLRRPIFLTVFNRFMDKPQRSATLSIEAQSRSLAFAVVAPATGWVADHQGLGAAFLVIAAILALAAGLGLLRPRGDAGSPPSPSTP